MADRKITDFLVLSALKTNTLFTVVDPDEGAPVDQNKKIPVSGMFTTFEPTFAKNTAFNKNFAGSGAATTVSRSDHVHSGVYEPAFSKNTGFNKDFGTGAGTVSQGDHTHGYSAFLGLSDTPSSYAGQDERLVRVNSTPDGLAFITATLSIMTDVTWSAKVAGDLFYYNGSLWTNLPVAQAKNTYSYFNNGGSGDNIYYTAGTLTLNNTLILTNVAADAGFDTSQMLSLDAGGNVDKIAASGGGTTNFLRADGAWAAPPGGGGTPGGATNEIQKNDGASAFAGSKIFSTADGDLTLGTGLSSQTRTITAAGTVVPIDLVLTPSGVASSIYLGQGSTSGSLFIGTTGAGGTERRVGVVGSQSNIDLVISPKGTGKVYWYDGTNNQEMGVYDDGSLTDSGTVTLNCSNQQQHIANWTTSQSTPTLSISNFGISSLVSVKKTISGDTTVTVSGTGYKFVNINNKALPATSVDILLSATINFTFELSLVKTGFTDGGDDVIHITRL